MVIKNLDKDFLEKVQRIFQEYGYETIAYDELGCLFSDYFMNTLVKTHKNNPSSIVQLKEIKSEKPIY